MSERAFDPIADSAGSFSDAIAALRDRHRAGEAIPATGYFARSKIKIVQLTPELLSRLPPPPFRDEGWQEALSQPGMGWAMREGVRVVMAGGVVPVWRGRGLAWLTHDGRPDMRHWLAAARWARHWFPLLPYRRIEATIACGFDGGIRWALCLGFEPEGLMRAFGEDGADYWLYARARP
jgi:hypothetical protein